VEVDMDETMQRLESYVSGLKTRGEHLPSRTRRQSPHFRAISAASGIDFKYLIIEPCKSRITLAVEEVGLAPKKGSLKYRREASYSRNSALLRNYLKWLMDNGLKLPEDPWRREEILFTQVEAEAGLGLHSLCVRPRDGDRAPNVLLRGMIKEAAVSLGMEVRVLPYGPGDQQSPITYAQLLEKGAEARAIELTDRPQARQQLYNTRWALKRFLAVLKIERTAPVGSELVTGFKTSLKTATGEITNDNSRKKLQTEMCWWRDCYQRLLKEASIPEGLHEAFAHLINRSGLPRRVLAKLVGVSEDCLRSWHLGLVTPSRLSLDVLRNMETLFKLPAGTLVTKMPTRSWSRRFRKADLPEFLRRQPQLVHRIGKHLPDDFCSLPVESQEQVVKSICTDILRGDDAYTQIMRELTFLPYRLTEWPSRLHNEFEEYAEFKTGERPPLGMRRSGQWKRPATKKKVHNEFAYFFGALRLPADAGDVRVRGLGLDEANFSLACVVCPLLVDWYIRFKCEKRTQYTDSIISLLKNFRSMLRPGTGWLRQKPQMARRLFPVGLGDVQLVTEEDISRARSNWGEACDAALEHYQLMIEEIEPLVEVARDPFSRIEGVVNMESPMEVIGPLVRALRDDLPNPHTQPVYYHRALRRCVIVLLFAVTGLRRNTLVQLDYRGDKTGHLFKRGGKFVLSIPRFLFKEENSPFFGPRRMQSDYFMELPDAHGFYELLGEYLQTSRPFLLNKYHRGCAENPLFVATGRTLATGEKVSPRLSPITVSEIYREVSERYLVENKWRGTGIAKVKRHGPHSVRHIRGTAAVKKTGSLQDAADANHNSVKTARKHYARFLPADKNRRVNDVLF
jgi:hypothetical protein